MLSATSGTWSFFKVNGFILYRLYIVVETGQAGFSRFDRLEYLYPLASAFYWWFENAEEDLTDPVRFNSIEEIGALREARKID